MTAAKEPAQQTQEYRCSAQDRLGCVTVPFGVAVWMVGNPYQRNDPSWFVVDSALCGGAGVFRPDTSYLVSRLHERRPPFRLGVDARKVLIWPGRAEI